MQDSYIITSSLIKKVQLINLTKNYAKFGPQIQSTTKHRMFRAKKICQSRKYYTSAAGDA